MQAAKDATAVTRSQVSDDERQLIFNVSQQFVAAVLAKSTVEFAQQNLDSFRQTVDISDQRYKAGDMSEGDLLKIKLQLFQFESDLANGEARQSPGPGRRCGSNSAFESVPDNYDIEGDTRLSTG